MFAYLTCLDTAFSISSLPLKLITSSLRPEWASFVICHKLSFLRLLVAMPIQFINWLIFSLEVICNLIPWHCLHCVNLNILVYSCFFFFLQTCRAIPQDARPLLAVLLAVFLGVGQLTGAITTRAREARLNRLHDKQGARPSRDSMSWPGSATTHKTLFSWTRRRSKEWAPSSLS